MPAYASDETIQDWLKKLPADILRVKLLIGLEGQPGSRYLFERVGNKVSPYRQKVRLGGNVPNSAILIGPHLDVKALEAMTKDSFNQNPL